MTATDHTRFAEWDAAYVLGALSPAERREFEDHLEECDRCRAAVAELSALPGLLGRLDETRAFGLLAGDDVTAAPPADLIARIERADRSRRWRRGLGTIAGVAAAAALATVLTLVVPPLLAPTADPAVAAELQPADDTVPVEASVALTSFDWGTRIDMECGYRSSAAGPDGGYGAVDYAMWVVDEHGTETPLSSWTAPAQGAVAVSAGTALHIDEIAEIEVRSADGERVLLSTSL